jgi:metal-responsive CopG/Arc/MetJ family transcriptional regulator
LSRYILDYFPGSKYKKYMPTNKPKVLITMDDELLERVDDFRFDNRINSRSEAIRRLINEALKKYEKKNKK